MITRRLPNSYHYALSVYRTDNTPRGLWLVIYRRYERGLSRTGRHTQKSMGLSDARFFVTLTDVRAVLAADQPTNKQLTLKAKIDTVAGEEMSFSFYSPLVSRFIKDVKRILELLEGLTIDVHKLLPFVDDLEKDYWNGPYAKEGAERPPPFIPPPNPFRRKPSGKQSTGKPYRRRRP